MISTSDLKHIDRMAVLRRLRELGWTELAKPGAFRDRDGRLFLVPDSLSSDLDFAALRSVLTALLEIEGALQLRDLTSRLEGRKEDLLYFGCEIEGAASGRLPVRFARSFYEMASRYFKTAAQGLIQRRGESLASTALFDRLQYGQTSEGSYKVTVHVPVDTAPDPAGRQLVRESVGSFQVLSEAVQKGDDRGLLSDRRASWTAPMCEALLRFTEQPVFSELKLQAATDPAWEEPASVPSDEIVIPLKSAPTNVVLSAAAAKLRGLSQSQFVEVVGIPYASRDDAVIGEGETRSISIKWLRQHEPPMKVQARLSQEGYEEALGAVSKRQIRLSGWLRQHGSRWILDVEGGPTLLDLMSVEDQKVDDVEDVELD